MTRTSTRAPWRSLSPLLVAGVLGLTSCGGSGGSSGQENSRPTQPGGPIGSGSKTLTCHSGGVFIGSGRPNWRRLSFAAGPFGLAHSAADSGRRLKDGRFHTKGPVIVQGHRRVVLQVPRIERDRVAIAVVDPDPSAGPWSRVVFVSCDNKPRTVWPAGLVLRDRSPITLRVGVGDEWIGAIRVARRSRD